MSELPKKYTRLPRATQFTITDYVRENVASLKAAGYTRASFNKHIEEKFSVLIQWSTLQQLLKDAKIDVSKIVIDSGRGRNSGNTTDRIRTVASAVIRLAEEVERLFALAGQSLSPTAAKSVGKLYRMTRTKRPEDGDSDDDGDDAAAT